MDCIFCQIVAGNIPSETLYHDEQVIAFRDINPQAPVHILIIPKNHIAALTQLVDTTVVAHMVDVANQMAREKGIFESGYRLVINCGQEGGQLVPHLHMHLLGGRRLSGTLG